MTRSFRAAATIALYLSRFYPDGPEKQSLASGGTRRRRDRSKPETRATADQNTGGIREPRPARHWCSPSPLAS